MDGFEAYDSGRTIGLGFSITLPLSFLIGALRYRNDSEYDAKCVRAFLLAASGWLLSALFAAAVRFSSASIPAILAGILAVPLSGAAAVYAVLGLISVGARRGRGLGIAALAISGLFFAGLLGGFFTALAGVAKVPSSWKMPELSPGSIIDLPQHGYTYTVPPEPWVRVRPQQINPNAHVAFVHERKQVLFALLAVPISPGVVLSDEDLVSSSHLELQQMDKAAAFDEAIGGAAGAFSGLSFRAAANVQKRPLIYRYWVAAQPAYAFILVAWGPRSAERDLDALSQEVFNGFGSRE